MFFSSFIWIIISRWRWRWLANHCVKPCVVVNKLVGCFAYKQAAEGHSLPFSSFSIWPNFPKRKFLLQFLYGMTSPLPTLTRHWLLRALMLTTSKESLCWFLYCTPVTLIILKIYSLHTFYFPTEHFHFICSICRKQNDLWVKCQEQDSMEKWFQIKYVLMGQWVGVDFM